MIQINLTSLPYSTMWELPLLLLLLRYNLCQYIVKYIISFVTPSRYIIYCPHVQNIILVYAVYHKPCIAIRKPHNFTFNKEEGPHWMMMLSNTKASLSFATPIIPHLFLKVGSHSYRMLPMTKSYLSDDAGLQTMIIQPLKSFCTDMYCSQT